MKRPKEDPRIGRCAALVLRLVAEIEEAGIQRHVALDLVENGLLKVALNAAREHRAFVEAIARGRRGGKTCLTAPRVENIKKREESS